MLRKQLVVAACQRLASSAEMIPAKTGASRVAVPALGSDMGCQPGLLDGASGPALYGPPRGVQQAGLPSDLVRDVIGWDLSRLLG